MLLLFGSFNLEEGRGDIVDGMRYDWEAGALYLEVKTTEKAYPTDRRIKQDEV